MGACDISFTIDSKASVEQIRQAFQRQREQDSEENGHQSGYSGDFQTVGGIDFKHLGKVFNSYHDAFEFCMENAQKWGKVLAVYYFNGIPVKSTKLDKLLAKIKITQSELSAAKALTFDRAKEFKTCTACKSRLAVKHVRGGHCPVCSADLRPKSTKDKVSKLNVKVEELTKQAEELNTALVSKQVARAAPKDIKTLIAGLGAC